MRANLDVVDMFVPLGADGSDLFWGPDIDFSDIDDSSADISVEYLSDSSWTYDDGERTGCDSFDYIAASDVSNEESSLEGDIMDSFGAH